MREQMPLAIRLVARPVIGLTKVIQSYEVVGEAHLPASGPLLVVSNHTCHLDALTLAAAVYESGRVPRFATRADLFNVPFLGFFLKKADQVPIYRPDVIHNPQDGGTARSSFEAMDRVLARGKSLVVFPESSFTRDPDMWPMRAKTGAVRLALDHPDALIIPIAHWGNEDLIDQASARVRWRKIGRKRTAVRVMFGDPIDLTPFRGREVTHDLLAEASDTVMDSITELLVQLRGERSRNRRWDMKRDGDPLKEAFEKGQRVIAQRQEKRLRKRRALKKFAYRFTKR